VNLGDGDFLDQRAAAMVVVLGEGGASLSGGTRTGAWLTLRNSLNDALDYRENKGDFERGMRRAYTHSMADLDALQGVINGNTPLIVSIDRASDIEVLIDLVNEYGISAIIIGGSEAWMLASELAAARIPVIVGPTANLPGNFDRINARLGTASILINAGVKVAIADSDAQTHNARNMTQSAGNAVAFGLDWDAALRAITLTPAEIFGMALELTNYPDAVFIKGEAVPMESRQTMLRDRYMQTDRPPAYRD
jgi:imidazolonepropionase-like amidohydrolase